MDNRIVLMVPPNTDVTLIRMLEHFGFGVEVRKSIPELQFEIKPERPTTKTVGKHQQPLWYKGRW